MVNEEDQPQGMVVLHGLTKEQLADVAAACGRLGASVLVWDDDFPLEATGAIVVSALRAGERRIPEPVLAVLAPRGPAASVLLLCEEALVRPSVSLHAGRVTLLGDRAGVDAIYGRLRVLLADRLRPRGAERPHETSSPSFWSCATGARERSLQFLESDGGFTLFFSLDGPISAPPPALARIRDALAREERSSSETDELGEDTGVLRFLPERHRLRVTWPHLPQTLWISSAQRLPALSDLSRMAEPSNTIHVVSGDVILAVSKGATAHTPDFEHEVPIRAALGGPSVLDSVGESLKQLPHTWATVMELR